MKKNLLVNRSMALVVILCLLFGIHATVSATEQESSRTYLDDLSVDPSAKKVTAKDISNFVSSPWDYNGKKFYAVGNLGAEIGTNLAYDDRMTHIVLIDSVKSNQDGYGLIMARKFLFRKQCEAFVKKMQARPFKGRYPETFNLKPELNCTVWFTVLENQKFPIRVDRIKYPDGRIVTKF